MWLTELEWRLQVLWGACHIPFKGWLGLLVGLTAETFMLWPAWVSVNDIKRPVIDIHFSSGIWCTTWATGWGRWRGGGWTPPILSVWLTYRGEHLAGADAIVEAHPRAVVGVLARAEDVLVAHVVRLLIGHPVTTAHTDGVTTVEVPEGVHAVTAALPVTALEVAALVEDYLEEGREKHSSVMLLVAVHWDGL